MQVFTFKRIASFSLALGIIFIALILLCRNIANITLAGVIDAVKHTSANTIGLAMLATFISFIAIAINEVIAVQSLRSEPVPWKVPVLAGVIGNALGNTLGFHVLTVSAWRYKVYARAGLSAMSIIRITAVALLGVIFGFAGAFAYSLLLDSHPISVLPAFNGQIRHIIGCLLLIAILGVVIWTGRKPRQIFFKSRHFTLPDGKSCALQALIGLLDILAAMYAAYILLPPDITVNYAHFGIIYISAVLFGIISQSPGGLGVFEAGIMAALGVHGRADVLAGLLLYRIVYNLLPFALSCLTILIMSARRRFQLDKG